MSKEKELSWTGERLVTQITNLRGTIEHLHRYAIALDLCSNKDVLDIASGEGYGSNLLSSKAKKVYGVDISETAIKHAKEKYTNPNIIFKVGSTSKIPIEDNSIDLVVSFETIEHHDEHEKMILEIRRVLRPTGILVISSPEKKIYKERDPNNHYHIKELTILEFSDLINNHFSFSKLYAQRYVTGSIISAANSNDVGKFKFYDGNFNAITNDLKWEDFYNKPYFNFIICSNNINLNLDLQLDTASFFNGYRVYDSEITDLKKSFDTALINTHNLYKNSMRYRCGNFLLKPLYIIKDYFSFIKK